MWGAFRGADGGPGVLPSRIYRVNVQATIYNLLYLLYYVSHAKPIGASDARACTGIDRTACECVRSVAIYITRMHVRGARTHIYGIRHLLINYTSPRGTLCVRASAFARIVWENYINTHTLAHAVSGVAWQNIEYLYNTRVWRGNFHHRALLPRGPGGLQVRTVAVAVVVVSPLHAFISWYAAERLKTRCRRRRRRRRDQLPSLMIMIYYIASRSLSHLHNWYMNVNPGPMYTWSRTAAVMWGKIVPLGWS